MKRNTLINSPDLLTIKSLDLLVNNAGVFLDKNPDSSYIALGDLNEKILSDTLQINTIAPLLVTQTLLPALSNGKMKTIVNISSSLGSIARNHDGGRYAYRASKAALNAITRRLAIDLKGFIAISIHPGWVKTDMGGSNADITVEKSVTGMRNVIVKLMATDSGSFFDYSGKTLEW